MKTDGFIRLPCGGSITSSDKPHRQCFRVTRELGSNERPLTAILLHPPAIGHDDIEPWVTFAVASGFGRLCILYLFPYRAQDMNDIRKHQVPWGEGPLNRRIQDLEIHMTINQGGRVFADWGPDGAYKDADAMFLRRYDGSPKTFSPYPSPIYPIEVLRGAEAAA